MGYGVPEMQKGLLWWQRSGLDGAVRSRYFDSLSKEGLGRQRSRLYRQAT